MERARSISRSMLSYLKRAREQKEYLLKETREFERGKRHLANMMGIESQQMTQTDVDDAIKYLFPSGLFEPKARPMMKHPTLIYKAEKDAQFDEEGRPYHHLFYTTLPNYYSTLNQLGRTLRELNAYEDEQLAKGVVNPPDEATMSLLGKEWLSHQELCDKLLERVSEPDYEYLIKSLKHLTQHPYSERAKSFIEEYMKELRGQSLNLDLPELLRDEATGEIYTDMVTRKREHKVRVKTVLNGSGRVDIEGKDILYFPSLYLRRTVLFPMQLARMTDRIDIMAKIVYKPPTLGHNSVAICIRAAVAKSIAAYVDHETRERLRLAGLLTDDMRVAERKKFGQEGARRKYTWKKR